MPVVAAPEQGLGRPGEAPRRARPLALPRPGLYATLCAASLALAAASLALASGPAYDPWSWIVWGREIAHFSLVTTGGPTWKPLPVLFTTVFAPFGAAAPDLWLVVARAGGIMAVALAAVLAGRLTGSGGRRERAAGNRLDLRAGNRLDWLGSLAAGALAGLGLLTLYQFAGGVATGESEGLLVALILLAILRHLDGAPRQALALGFAAALLRPETWPFLGVYGVWLWRRDAGARVLIVSLLTLTGLLWVVPELWGSGSLTRGVQWAQYPRQGSPAFAHCPFCAEISGSAWPLLTMPFKAGLVLALGSLFATGPRTARLALAGVVVLGLTWVLEEAVLTQIGFSGSDRYLTAPLALLIVAGAAGWGRVLVRPGVAAALAGVALALSVAAFGRGPHPGAQLDGVRLQARIRTDLASAVAQAGGAGRLLACGAVQTNPSEGPLAAWTLGVPLTRTESTRGDVVIQSGGASSPEPEPARRPGYRWAAGTAAVRIFVRCR